MNHNSKLAARVAAKNRANQLAFDAQKTLLPIFAQFVGQKIVNGDGSFVVKLRNLVKESIATYDGGNSQIYLYGSRYSICYVAKTWEQFNGCSYYAETSFYLGELQNGNTLEKLCNPLVCHAVLTEEAILQARVEVKKARKILQDAESALCGFGEYDN